MLNEFDAVAIGEVGADDALGVMADYTADGDKLHMAYSFNLLTPEFSAAHIRSQVEQFEARVKGGWASWSVGNHDSMRVMSRWGGAEPSLALARLVLAMQLSLKGTPCLYQGDELALTEADVPFELLQDPYGITFWPEFKGRDGCRTPMPWDASAPHAGFTSGAPWLPVASEHAARAASTQENDPDSTLNAARRLIAWRRTLPQLTRGDIVFFDAPEPVLALRRDLDGHKSVLAAFNLGAHPVSFAWREATGADSLTGHGLPGSASDGMVSLPAYGAWFGTVD